MNVLLLYIQYFLIRTYIRTYVHTYVCTIHMYCMYIRGLQCKDLCTYIRHLTYIHQFTYAIKSIMIKEKVIHTYFDMCVQYEETYTSQLNA